MNVCARFFFEVSPDSFLMECGQLAHLGLKPEATAEGSQLKRAVGLFEVNLVSNVLVRLVQAVEWMMFIMAVVMGRRAAGWSCELR
jgi:hypothetical protein